MCKPVLSLIQILVQMATVPRRHLNLWCQAVRIRTPKVLTFTRTASVRMRFPAPAKHFAFSSRCIPVSLRPILSMVRSVLLLAFGFEIAPGAIWGRLKPSGAVWSQLDAISSYLEPSGLTWTRFEEAERRSTEIAQCLLVRGFPLYANFSNTSAHHERSTENTRTNGEMSIFGT